MLIINVIFRPKGNNKLLDLDKIYSRNSLQNVFNNQIDLTIKQTEDEKENFQKLNRLIEIICDLKDQLQEFNASFRIVHKMISNYLEKEWLNKSIQNRTFIERIKGNEFISNYENSNIDAKLISLISKVNVMKYLNYLQLNLNQLNSSKQFSIVTKVKFEFGQESSSIKNTIYLSLKLKKTICNNA